MRLYLRLAWRNLWRHRRRTLIVVLAIGLTLAMMMMYDGLIAGFEQAIYGNAIKVLGGNIQVHAEGYHDKPNQTPLLRLPDENLVLKAAAVQPNVVSGNAAHQHRRSGQQPGGRIRRLDRRHRAGKGAANLGRCPECHIWKLPDFLPTRTCCSLARVWQMR